MVTKDVAPAGSVLFSYIVVQCAELIKRHGACGGNVQRVHTVRHGNLHRVVAMLDRRVCKAVTLGAKHNGELRLFLQTRVGEGKRVVAQRMAAVLKPRPCSVSCHETSSGQIRPRHLKYCAHAHAACAAIQRVAAGGGQ